MILTGNTLGKRQHELNIKVNEAAAKKVKFSEIETEPDKSDLDQFFKIDLASKYKNIDYIVQVLKSGDSLYISRALKCDWLFDDEHSEIINPKYLHDNIFPLVSLKMKMKILTKISLNVTTDNRITAFYEYCRSSYLQNIALKFIYKMSATSKLKFIKNNVEGLKDKGDSLIFFIGNSFELADVFLKEVGEYQGMHYIYKLRYMYSVSDVRYLDLLEKCYENFEIRSNVGTRMGLRMSKDIMRRHKNRVLRNAAPYVHFVNKKILVKYLKIDEAKVILNALLPKECSIYWSFDFCSSYEHILDLIPAEEKFSFIKNIFVEKYPEEPFEMTYRFFNLGYYKYMTTEEKEAWALHHVASKNEILGSGQDYKWYKFVNFDLALVEIKKLILITPDLDKRCKMLNVLVESARNQQELEKLLNYYCMRHINEATHNRECFLDCVIETHKVLDFEEQCWQAFNKLLFRNEVYNLSHWSYKNESVYRVLSLIYHIIHNKDIPDSIDEYIESKLCFWNLSSHFHLLNEQRQEQVFSFILQYFVNKLKHFDSQCFNSEIQEKTRPYIRFVLDLLEHFKKSDERPEIVTKYMKLDPETYFSETSPTENNMLLTQSELMRTLKQNADELLNKLVLVEYNFKNNSYNIRLQQLLKKLKIYFSNDIGQTYLNSFKKWLSKPDINSASIYLCIYGIFQLGDEQFKCGFIDKYVPKNPKIDHSNIDRNLLYIQEAICRFACFSRPPVPLLNISKYIVGDYVHYCMPMFGCYLSNLPRHLCISFVESLLNKPVSIQKHGLRLAFKSFSVADLKTLIIKVWTKTKNISLRMVIYTYLFKDVLEKSNPTQMELFEVLKTLTRGVHEDDHEDVIRIITGANSLPDHLKGSYLETAWNTVSNFSDNIANLNHKVTVINTINCHIELMDKCVIESIIHGHVHKMLVEKQILNVDANKKFYSLTVATWQLTVAYTVIFDEDVTVQELVKTIINQCLASWHEVGIESARQKYVYREFCFGLISDIMNTHSARSQKQKQSTINDIFEIILKGLCSLPLHEIYMFMWNLRLAILTNKVIDEGIVKFQTETNKDKETVKNIIKAFATEISKLFNEFLNKKIYLRSFEDVIAQSVYDNVQRISKAVNKSEYKEDIMSFEDLMIYCGLALLDFKSLETNVVVARLVPAHLDTSIDLHKNILSSLKSLDNLEIYCLLYDRFTRNGYRKNMEL